MDMSSQLAGIPSNWNLLRTANMNSSTNNNNNNNNMIVNNSYIDNNNILSASFNNSFRINNNNNNNNSGISGISSSTSSSNNISSSGISSDINISRLNDISSRSNIIYNIDNINSNNNANNNNNTNSSDTKLFIMSPVSPANAAIINSQMTTTMTAVAAAAAASAAVTNTATTMASTVSASSTQLRVVHHKSAQNKNAIAAGALGVPSNNRITNASSNKEFLFSTFRLLSDRYLLLNQITGSSFYECIDVRNGDALICKAIGNSYAKILSAYFRMDGDAHIKPLHRILQSQNQTYLLLPRSQYGDLHSYVRERKRLRESEARQLFRQICETVKSCHSQGIVLRDLKLRKFVFSDHNRTSLLFESLEDAVVFDNPDDDLLIEKIGCPAYVAPEILKPNSDFSGKAADLWSLGVILYTMLVGRYPFNDPEHSSLFAKISRCQFTIPDFLSAKARCLIRSLLQKVPKHRITSEDVLYHPWLQETNETSISFSGTTGSSSASSCSSYGDAVSFNDDQVVPDMDSFDYT